MNLKYIGTVINSKGLDGTMLITDVPDYDIRIRKGATIFIGLSKSFNAKYSITLWKQLKQQALLKVSEINNPELAKTLKEQGVFVDETLLKTKRKDEYFIEQIVGCKVKDVDSGEMLGKISDVWLLPANDVWVLKTETGELPLPVIDDVIIDIDIKKKIIFVRIISGLLELTESEEENDE